MELTPEPNSRLPWRVKFCFLAVLLSFVYLTSNNYRGGDAPSYEVITKAAPGLPTELLPYHHAQRFVIPYVLGVVAKTAGLNEGAALTAASLSIILGNICLLFLLCNDLKLDESTIILVTSLFVLNPYSFRYYLCTPPMLNDTAFVLGVLVSFLALKRGWLQLLMLGVTVAATSRQNALMMTPIWVLWIYWQSGISGRKRHAAALFAVMVPVLVYYSTGRIAQMFALPAWNIDHVLGLFFWIAKEFNLRELMLFSMRFSLTFLMTAAIFLPVLARKRRHLRNICQQRPEIVLLALSTIAIISQPVLAGPHISLKDIQRLAGMALGPLLLCLAGAVPVVLAIRWRLVVIALLSIASLHHLFSFYGPAKDLSYHFALAHALIAAIVAAIVWSKAECRFVTKEARELR